MGFVSWFFINFIYSHLLFTRVLPTLLDQIINPQIRWRNVYKHTATPSTTTLTSTIFTIGEPMGGLSFDIYSGIFFEQSSTHLTFGGATGVFSLGIFSTHFTIGGATGGAFFGYNFNNIDNWGSYRGLFFGHQSVAQIPNGVGVGALF